MKRSMVLAGGLLVLAGICGAPVSFAEEMKVAEPGCKTCGMGGKGHGMPGAGMMDRQVVATADGGIIIVAGAKVVKYDKDLNLVKEIELGGGMPSMHGTKMGGMKQCPVMMK
jgi:hypothetical protein